MSLYSKKGLIERIRRGKKARANLVSSNLDKGIAFQIRAIRDEQGLTQANLAREVGMTQNNLSRLEDETYGKHTLNSLKRIAEALDVALVVRLVPFSQYIDWLSGTARVDKGISFTALTASSFQDEEKAGVFEAPTPSHYFPVFSTEVPTTREVTIPGAVGIRGGGSITVIPFPALNQTMENVEMEKRA